MCDRSLDVVHGLPDQCRLTEVEARTGGGTMKVWQWQYLFFSKRVAVAQDF